MIFRHSSLGKSGHGTHDVTCTDIACATAGRTVVERTNRATVPRMEAKVESMERANDSFFNWIKLRAKRMALENLDWGMGVGERIKIYKRKN